MIRVPISMVAQINPRPPKGLDDSQEISFLPMAAVSEDGKITSQETRNFSAVKKGYTYFERGDILLAKITPCFENGKAAVTDSLDHQIGFGSTEFHVLRANPKIICANYLFSLVWSRRFRYLGEKSMKGAAGQKRVPADFLKNYDIPLPPLDDQIRIAHLLGKVEGLIAQRKQHLQQLDDLLKSVFLEMFGDPVRNEKGWDIHPLGSIGEVQGGLQVTTKRNEYKLDAPYLRVANVYRDRLSLCVIKRIGLTLAELERVRLQKGDLLIVEGHGNPEEVGRSAVWNGLIENCVHQNHLIRFRVDASKITPQFASFFINSSGGRQQMFRAGKTTSGLNTISSKNVKETIAVVPPLQLQNQFGAFVEKVEGIKTHYQQNLTDLETLYGALSQQAFKGELDLSRVTLPVEGGTDDTKGAETQEKQKPFSQGFARQLLAAEILARHNVHNMTQMKLQKLLHLCEYHAELDELGGDYQRQAAGPYDNKMMYGIAGNLKKQQWFEIRGQGKNATYSPLAKLGSHDKYLPHWQDKMARIEAVLNLLGKANPEQCEIVSTLYAAWNDLMIDGEAISDEKIIEQVSKAESWHKAKESIDPDRWPKALQWMREKKLLPRGYGRHTRKLQ